MARVVLRCRHRCDIAMEEVREFDGGRISRVFDPFVCGQRWSVNWRTVVMVIRLKKTMAIVERIFHIDQTRAQS